MMNKDADKIFQNIMFYYIKRIVRLKYALKCFLICLGFFWMYDDVFVKMGLMVIVTCIGVTLFI